MVKPFNSSPENKKANRKQRQKEHFHLLTFSHQRYELTFFKFTPAFQNITKNFINIPVKCKSYIVLVTSMKWVPNNAAIWRVGNQINALKPDKVITPNMAEALLPTYQLSVS
jgi:hypothetical protein